jgi:hypothetical protein
MRKSIAKASRYKMAPSRVRRLQKYKGSLHDQLQMTQIFPKKKKLSPYGVSSAMYESSSFSNQHHKSTLYSQPLLQVDCNFGNTPRLK